MGDRVDSILLSGRMGGAVMRYPTLTACAETLLGDFFRQCEHVEELNAREEATMVAIDRLYDRRLREIRTHNQMQEIKGQIHVGDLMEGEDME